MTSKKYTLDYQDLKKLARDVLYIFTPVIILATQQFEASGTLDYKILCAAGASIFFIALRKFITDYTKK